MNTTWHDRQRIEDSLAEDGEMPSPAQVGALLADAHRAEQLEQQFEALTIALADVGLKIIDTTTDDDDCQVLEIISIQEP